MNKEIKNYIFDLDGTLINSCDEVMECFEKAFKLSEYPLDRSRLTENLIGPPLREIVLNIAPEINDEEILSRIIANFRQVYDNDENDSSKLYPNVPEILNRLKTLGKKLYLATLKPTKPTMRILRSFGLDVFDDVYTIDKFGAHITKKEMITDIVAKYGLNKDETVMVGDAVSDVVSANESGIKSVGVLWGYGEDKTELIKNSACVVEKIGDIECIEM